MSENKPNFGRGILTSLRDPYIPREQRMKNLFLAKLKNESQ